MKRVSPAWLILLLPLLWLAPLLGDPTQVHPAVGAQYSDIVVAHWPSAEFLRSSLRQYGEVPFWNPHTLGGTPFAADPLSGLYYPPLWLALLLPPALAFNFLFFLHLAFAGVGAFLLAREEGAGERGALLAGIAFGGLPKLIAHTAAGHVSLVLAVSWTPWLFLAVREAACRQSLRRWSLAGMMAGIVFLADPRWLLPSALAAVAYAVFFEGRGLPLTRRKRFLSWFKHLAVFTLFAAGIAAVLALPMAEFVALSTRADLSGAESTVLSLPFSALVGVVFGGLGGSIEWVVYPGVVVLVLVLISIPRPTRTARQPVLNSRRGKESRGNAGVEGEVVFWWLLLLFSVIFSLGSNIPGLARLMDTLPGGGLLRVPPRWMFLAGLALAMLAARGLTKLESAADGRGFLKKAGFTLTVGGWILAAAAAAMGLPAALWQDGLVWGAAGVIIFVGFMPGRWNLPASSALLCLAVVDLAVADARMIDPHPVETVSAAVAEVSSRISEDSEAFRVYSPSASIPPLAAVQYGLRTLDGIDPLILRWTAETVSAAVHVPATGYSVTLPEFETGTPETDNRDVVPAMQSLGLLNVRYIASAFDIPSSMIAGCEQIGAIRLCSNLLAMPRAWVAEGIEKWDTPSAGRSAEIDFETPNRIRLTASGPGIVVLADAWYPAWRATVDGKPVEVMQVGGWWRAVEVGLGEHLVEMRYDPVLSRIGLLMCALALLAYGGVRRWAA